jgi:uncharacterized protein YkwD
MHILPQLFSLLTLIFFCLIQVNVYAHAEIEKHKKSSWNKEMYEKYNWQSFYGYKPANETIDIKNIDYALLNAAVFYVTNYFREKNNLAPFKHNENLESAASGHSTDMVNFDFFSHKSPVKNKEQFVERMKAAGVTRFAEAAENIAQNYIFNYESGRGYFGKYVGENPDFTYSNGEKVKIHTYLTLAQALLAQWMRSKGHRENILNRNLSHLGCGVALKKREGDNVFEKVFATQVFAKIR